MIRIIKGDITKIVVDAVVNAANSHMLTGSGVDYAISKAAGFEMDRFRTGIKVKPGSAIVTPAFNMDTAKWIIHAVAPRYYDISADCDCNSGHEMTLEIAKQTLYRAYEESLFIAKSLGCKSIAFPCLGTGVYGWPKEIAADIAIAAMCAYGEELEITVVCFDDENYNIYKELCK